LQPRSEVDAPFTHSSHNSNSTTELKNVPDPFENNHGSHRPVNAVQGTGRRLAIAAVVVAIALVAGFLSRRHRNAQVMAALEGQTAQDVRTPAAIDVVRISLVPSAHTLSFPGEARAWYQSTIYARVSGYVATWSGDIGQQVKKGQPLAAIDTPELDEQLIASRAKLKAARSEVEVAQASSQFAKKTYDRWWDSPKGVVSEQEREEKKSAYESSAAKLDAAKSQVNLEEADLSRLETMQRFKTVTAPFDGTIIARRVDIGDLVTAGSTSNTTSLYDIAQYDTIRVFVDVPESVASEISDQMPATAIARELPGRTFAGTVARTSRSIDPASRTLRVEVDVKNLDFALLPGMYLNVDFKANQPMPVLRIPASALTFRSGGPEVAVVASDGTVRFHGVSIARDLGDSIEIATGLESGDRVALNIGNQTVDGDHVTANEVDAIDGAPPRARQAAAVAVKPN
jgi:RND family efflux transporter MFP subunit